MQDDYNRFIRNSIRQAQCEYEDIFEADVMETQSEAAPCRRAAMPAKQASRRQAACGGCAGVKDAQGESRGTEGCGCDKKRCSETALPVMVFIEPQTFGRTYNEAEALRQGTLFPALDKPFMGGGYRC